MNPGANLGEARYLILADGHFGPESSKTATSAVRYLPERVAAVIDARHAGKTVRDVLGFGGDTPVVASVEEGLAAGPTALLIGIAPVGGELPEVWREIVRQTLSAGLDLVSGLHTLLGDDPELARLAREHGATIHDLRRTPAGLPVATGRAASTAALRVLTVGTDCNVGKMTAGLEIRHALQARGVRVGFAATGQTGILVEGWGTAVDAVKADFIAGAAEELVLRAAREGDVVLVEGQGSLTHPGYSGVTLGLMHGSLPDAMILCHPASRTRIFNEQGLYDWVPLPSLSEAVGLYEGIMRPVHPSRVVGIALNTRELTEAGAREAIATAERETGLPATDPVRFGADRLAEELMAARGSRLAARA